MRIIEVYSYRSAKEILQSVNPAIYNEIVDILEFPQHNINLENAGAQRSLSKQVQNWFVTNNWLKEQPSFSIAEMRYDLLKGNIPIEIELGHQRLVFPDFFEFLADFSKGYIPLGIMFVTADPLEFGHNWHCSLASTIKKINSIKEVYLVLTLIFALNP